MNDYLTYCLKYNEWFWKRIWWWITKEKLEAHNKKFKEGLDDIVKKLSISKGPIEEWKKITNLTEDQIYAGFQA